MFCIIFLGKIYPTYTKFSDIQASETNSADLYAEKHGIWTGSVLFAHYENMPIQIYWKSYH